jgi:hypothetical protein
MTIVPGLPRVAVLTNPRNPTSTATMKSAQSAAQGELDVAVTAREDALPSFHSRLRLL